MKKQIYLDTKFNNSICRSTLQSATLEQLKTGNNAILNAVEYHKQNKNESQIVFFSEALEFSNNRIKQLSKKK